MGHLGGKRVGILHVFGVGELHAVCDGAIAFFIVEDAVAGCDADGEERNQYPCQRMSEHRFILVVRFQISVVSCRDAPWCIRVELRSLGPLGSLGALETLGTLVTLGSRLYRGAVERFSGVAGAACSGFPEG